MTIPDSALPSPGCPMLLNMTISQKWNTQILTSCITGKYVTKILSLLHPFHVIIFARPFSSRNYPLGNINKHLTNSLNYFNSRPHLPKPIFATVLYYDKSYNKFIALGLGFILEEKTHHE